MSNNRTISRPIRPKTNNTCTKTQVMSGSKYESPPERLCVFIIVCLEMEVSAFEYRPFFLTANLHLSTLVL